MKKIIILFVFTLTALNQAYCDGPYMYGCTKWLYRIFPDPPICQSYGYITVPESINYCEGDSETIYACRPGECDLSTFQWWVDYWIADGLYFRHIVGRLTGETSNALIVPEFDGRTYYCKVTTGGETVETGHVTVHWNSSEGTVSTPMSDELVCLGDQVKLNFSISDNNTYKWYRKPIGGDWVQVPEENSRYYYFYPGLENNNTQYKCIANNACWSASRSSNVVTLTVNDLPWPDLGDDVHICMGDILTLGEDLSHEDNYTWSTGASTRTISVSDSGTFSVEAINSNNCKNYDTIRIDIDPSITPVDLGEDRSICMDSSVVLDAGSGYDSYSWSNGENTRQITVSTPGEYNVGVSLDGNVCKEGDTLNLEVVHPYPDEQICIVTVDLNTGKNMVVWEKTEDVGTMAYRIYREKTINDYDLIAEIVNPALSIFVDTAVSPEVRSYLYKITSVDTCRNESPLASSFYHRPIFLTYTGSQNGINLQWTDYKIQGMPDLEDYLTSFQIYRGTDSTQLSLLDEVGSINDYIDTDPNASLRRHYYRVAGVLKNPCYPTGAIKSVSESYQVSISNLDNNRMPDIIEATHNPGTGRGIIAFPNPFTDYATIRFANPGNQAYSLSLMDIGGKILFETNGIRGEEFRVDGKALNPGFYQVIILGEKIFRCILIKE